MARHFLGNNSSVSIFPPTNSSYVTRNIFSNKNWDYRYLFKVRESGISQTVVKQAPSKNEEGREMLHNFTAKQLPVINNLKYERMINSIQSEKFTLVIVNNLTSITFKHIWRFSDFKRNISKLGLSGPSKAKKLHLGHFYLIHSVMEITYIHTYIHKLYFLSNFRVACKY